MIQLFLQPVDVWLFRDGKPFEAGSGHRAESLFPPYPTTIQGAIRSHQLALENVGFTNKTKIEETVGKATTYEGLALRGPFMARQMTNGTAERLYPQPANAIYDEGDDSLTEAKLEEPPGGVITSSPFSQLPGLYQNSGKQKKTFWLTESNLVDFLEGKPVQGLAKDELYESENRIGIGIEKTHNRVVEEGMLYEAEFIRLKEHIGLLVEMKYTNEEKWAQGGILQLGGESRAAQYQAVTTSAWPQIPNAKRLKLYLATPAYFENGWLPKWDDYFDGSPSLVAGLVNRYESLGGFDWAVDMSDEVNAHRPARRYIPAGSVYYLEGKSSLSFKKEALSDFGAEIGFGQFIAKEW